jgi:hypothetical protein
MANTNTNVKTTRENAAEAAAVSQNRGRAKAETPTLTAAQKHEMERLPNISSKMRFLQAEGYETADIARIVNRRYQHVRNVLKQPLANKTAPASTETKQ